MEYLFHILIYIGIFAILSISLNLIVGYTGILSLTHAAFFGVGAYVVALMSLKYKSPFLLNLLIAIIVSSVLGALVSFPSFRIKNDYFILETFAFQIIIFSIFNNWISLTNGPLGLTDIPDPSIFGLRISSNFGFFILTLLCLIFTFWFSNKIIKAPFGRVLKAIREDEILVQSLGKKVSNNKMKIFMISAGLASIGGVLYATYVSFVDPSSFTIMESIFIISIVIIGGAGSLWGPVFGAALLIFIPELLRLLGLPNTIAPNVRQILYGGLLVAFMLWRPQGFFGEYSFNGKKSK